MTDENKLLNAINEAITNSSDDKVIAAKQAIITLRNTNDYEDFPLSDHFQNAAEKGHKEIVQWLLIALNELRQEAVDSLEEDEELNDHTEQGIDEVMYEACIKAATNCQFDIVKIINDDKLGEPTIDTYIFRAIEDVKPFNFNCFFKFVDINHTFKQEDDMTVAMEAAAVGNLDMVKYLFSKNFDIVARDKFGNTILSYALSGRDQPTIAFIISQLQPDSVARELVSHGGEERSYELSKICFTKWMI